MTRTKQDVVVEVLIAAFPGYNERDHGDSITVLADLIIEELHRFEVETRRPAQLPAEPGLQVAFADEARAVLGQPDAASAVGFVGQPVKITFNHTIEERRGVLTAMRGAPAARYLILDNLETEPLYLRSIQSITAL